MKSILLVLLLATSFFYSAAQKISDAFDPVIKQRPDDIGIKQTPDGNYLIYGDINYYDGNPCAAVIKVDQHGVPIQEFQKVETDHIIQHVVVLPSGKILIHGIFKYLNGQRVSNLARLNENGSVDHNFQLDDGITVGFFDVQSDGKVVAFTNATSFNRLVRFNTDGSIDNTFSVTVNVLLPISLLVNGEDEIYIVDLFTMLKLTKDGAVDPFFSFPFDPQTRLSPMTRQADGKLVIGVHNQNAPGATVIRIHPDGTVDESFHAGQANSQIQSICVRRNGKIAITGVFSQFDSHYANAVELNSDGSFNRVLFTVDFNDMFHIYEDDSENIFATGGFAAVNGYTIKRIVKIKPNYEFDRSFKLPVDRTVRDITNALAAQSTGKLLIGGGASFNGAGSDTSKIVRILPDGRLDPFFSPAIDKNPIPDYRGFVNTIAVQDDDKIIVGGGNIFDHSRNTLRRFLPDGQMDYAFQIGSGPTFDNGNMPATRLVRIKNSKIYIAGSFDGFNGAACKSFVILDMQGNKVGPDQNSKPDDFQFTDMEVQSDGKVIFMGFNPNGGEPGTKFLRLNSDGSVDDSFRLKHVNGNPGDLEIDEDDNILVSGNFLELQSNQILIRFSPDGDRDNSLDLGDGFTPINGFTTAYSAKVLKNKMIAIIGIFAGYRKTSSPGIVVIDYNGSRIPFNNPFDSTTVVSASTYANDTLYMIGRFSKNGTEIRSGAKMVFPSERVATGFEVVATSASSIELSWNAVKEDDFIIEGRSPSQSNYEIIATVPSGSESHNVQQLTEATQYHFRIKSAGANAEPSHFEESEITWILPQPAGPATDIGDKSFTANWTYLPGTDSCHLQVSADDFSHFIEGYENFSTTTGSATVTNLDENKQYRYRVKRFRNQKSSAYSEPVLVNLITDVEESLLQVSVYPNPVNKELLIEFPQRTEKGNVFIYSVDGKLVADYTFNDLSRLQIDTSSLSRGIFIITISVKGLTKKIKLVRSY